MVVLNRMSVVERVRIDANRLKGGAVKKRGCANYERVFQSKFGLLWFVPIYPPYEPITVESLFE